MKLLSLCAVLLSLTIVAAQEAPGALPNAYRVQFENAWVRVTNVRYGPLEKVPAHSHTPYPSAYVYLNDAGPVIFKHIGGHGTAAKRPATKAGAFRVYQGLDEIHEVENTTETPSEFLRVELKTEGVSAATFRGKFERPSGFSADLVQFDHPQLRVSRLTVPAAENRQVTASSDPVVLISLTTGAGFTVGQARWLPTAAAADIKNAGGAALEFLRFDLKTRPSTR